MTLQIIVNALITGGLYALVAFGFALIYNTLKFIPFFYGVLAIWAGYWLYLFGSFKIPFSISLLLSVILTCLISLSLNSWLLKNFRAKKASAVILLILGLALAIFLENLLLAVFGPNVKSIALPFQNQIVNVASATLTFTQIAIIFISIPFLIFAFYLLYQSRYGLIIRSLTTGPEMAEILGVNKEDIFRKVFIFAGMVAALVGILYGVEYNLEPTAGTSLMLKAFTAAVIGGLEFLPAAIFGGYFLGFVENLSVLFLPAAFKDGISFIILFLFLLLRPKGIFGKKSREEISG
jgi:branched-chain amino acid transport system permease protein